MVPKKKNYSLHVYYVTDAIVGTKDTRVNERAYSAMGKSVNKHRQFGSSSKSYKENKIG